MHRPMHPPPPPPQHDVVPRFSIRNMFVMKEEMDSTKWGDILADRLKDW